MKTSILALLIVVFSALAMGSANAQLSGAYTIGGPNPDFVDLNTAVTELLSDGGSGFVTFNIRPGVYTGQYNLTNIPGSLMALVIQGASGNAEDVLLQFDASSELDNYIFKIDGVSFVFIEKLSFHAQDEVYARSILFRNNADGLIVENCHFEGSQSDEISGDGQRSHIHCDQADLQNQQNPINTNISFNEFHYGSAAIDLKYDGFDAQSYGVVIEGNRCINQLYVGIDAQNSSGEIIDNFIATQNGFFFTGIRCFRFDYGSVVSGNQVQAYSSNSCTGLEYSNAQEDDINRIYNNMIYINGTGDLKGIHIFNLWGTNIDFNSVVIDGGLPEQSFAFLHGSAFMDGEDTQLRNNIFCSLNESAAFRTDLLGNIGTFTHNDLYSAGSTLAWVGIDSYSNLENFQLATGLGDACVNINPGYPALPNLHLYNCALDDLGLQIEGIIMDLDGEARDGESPDMGADEFNYDASPIAFPTYFVDDVDLPYTLGFSEQYESYEWSTGSVEASIDANAEGEYTCVVTDEHDCTYSFIFDLEVVITNISENRILNTLNVFPNPASSLLTWDFRADYDQYFIFNSTGKCVMSERIYGINKIDVSHLSSGLYLIQFQNTGSTSIARFLKE